MLQQFIRPWCVPTRVGPHPIPRQHPPSPALPTRGLHNALLSPDLLLPPAQPHHPLTYLVQSLHF